VLTVLNSSIPETDCDIKSKKEYLFLNREFSRFNLYIYEGYLDTHKNLTKNEKKKTRSGKEDS